MSDTGPMVLWFFLLAEGIEANPGPGSGSGDSRGSDRVVEVRKVIPRGVEVLNVVSRGVEALKVATR